MHTWQTFALLLFAAACIVSLAEKAWAVAAIAAGLACTLVPAVFSVT